MREGTEMQMEQARQKRLIACSIVFLVLWADIGKEKHCFVEQASNLEDMWYLCLCLVRDL